MDQPIGYLLSDDLIFASRITATAREVGISIKVARNADVLVECAQKEKPRCVLVDLGNPGLVVGDLMGRLRETCSPLPRIVGYGSHVDVAGLRAAREAGCEPVLPRSKFIEVLPTALPSWFTDAKNS